MSRRARYMAVWRGKRTGKGLHGEPLLSTSAPVALASASAAHVQFDSRHHPFDASASVDSLPTLSTKTAKSHKKRQDVVYVLSKTVRAERRLKRVLLRDVLMMCNALFSLALGVAMLEYSWDGAHLVDTVTSQCIKAFITFSTTILILQLLEFYVALVQMKMKDMHNSPDHSIMRVKHPTFLVVWQNSSASWKFWAEVLVCLPHPLPGIGTYLDHIGTLWMFLRLYTIIKVLRDLSPIWNAKTLPKIPGYSRGIQPTFTAWRAVKTYFYAHPVWFVIVWIAVVSLTCAYGIYIFERETHPDWIFPIYFYLSICAMASGWPADVFDKYDVTSWGAKIVSIGCSVLGIFLFALLIDYLHSVMQLSYNEKFVYDWLNKKSYDNKIRHAAAKMIQLVWRHHRWKKTKRQLMASFAISPIERRKTMRSAQKKFNSSMVRTVKEFQSARRRKFMVFGADDPTLHPALRAEKAAEEDIGKKKKAVSFARHSSEPLLLASAPVFEDHTALKGKDIEYERDPSQHSGVHQSLLSTFSVTELKLITDLIAEAVEVTRRDMLFDFKLLLDQQRQELLAGQYDTPVPVTMQEHSSNHSSLASPLTRVDSESTFSDGDDSFKLVTLPQTGPRQRRQEREEQEKIEKESESDSSHTRDTKREKTNRRSSATIPRDQKLGSTPRERQAGLTFDPQKHQRDKLARKATLERLKEREKELGREAGGTGLLWDTPTAPSHRATDASEMSRLNTHEGESETSEAEDLERGVPRQYSRSPPNLMD